MYAKYHCTVAPLPAIEQTNFPIYSKAEETLVIELDLGSIIFLNNFCFG